MLRPIYPTASASAAANQARYRDWAVEVAREFAKRTGSGRKLRAVDARPNPYGVTGFIDPSGDNDLMSLSLAGSDPLGDALGYMATEVETYDYPYLNWIAPDEYIASAGATARTLGISDESAPRPDATSDVRYYRQGGFGLIGRKGGTISTYGNTLPRIGTPRLRLDGTPINSNEEWRALTAVEVIAQDNMVMRFSGNAATAGQYNGLQRIINTGKLDTDGNAFPAMDSIIVTWDSGDTAAGGAAEWIDAQNPVGSELAIANGTHIIDVLEEIHRRFLFRIQYSRAMSRQALQVGDVILVGSFNAVNRLATLMATRKLSGSGITGSEEVLTAGPLAYRNMFLNQGMFGYGHIELNGMEVPMLAEGYGVGNDLYLLTRKVGPTPTLYHEYYDMNNAVPQVNTLRVTDGGRFHHFEETAGSTKTYTVDFKTRLICPAPWLQARVTGFTATNLGGPIFADPAAASFFGGDTV